MESLQYGAFTALAATRRRNDHGGGDTPQVTLRVAKTLLPGFDPDGDLGLLSARITAVAVAAPRSNVRE